MKNRIIAAALFFLVIFSSVSFAVTKWACVGDSITVGWKLSVKDSYCYKLGILLGVEYEVTNCGVSGTTMIKDRYCDIKSYWETQMFIDSQEYNPDIVSIMLGTNDALPDVWDPYSHYYYPDAMDMVGVYHALASGSRVILMTCPPCRGNNDRNPGILEINSMIPDIALEAGCEWVDVYTALVKSGLSEHEIWKDPVHLTGAAHTVIAELLYDYITSNP